MVIQQQRKSLKLYSRNSLLMLTSFPTMFSLNPTTAAMCAFFHLRNALSLQKSITFPSLFFPFFLFLSFLLSFFSFPNLCIPLEISSTAWNPSALSLRKERKFPPKNLKSKILKRKMMTMSQELRRGILPRERSNWQGSLEWTTQRLMLSLCSNFLATNRPPPPLQRERVSSKAKVPFILFPNQLFSNERI